MFLSTATSPNCHNRRHAILYHQRILGEDSALAYGSDVEMIAYLARTGRVLPINAVPEQVREIGSDYVDSLEDLYCGVAVSYDASFPRDLYPTVPVRVEQAAYEAAYAFATGVPIFGGGGTAGGQVTKEKVDVLEVSYAEPQSDDWWAANRYILPLAYAKLLPFICLPDDGEGCRGGPAAFIV